MLSTKSSAMSSRAVRRGRAIRAFFAAGRHTASSTRKAISTRPHLGSLRRKACAARSPLLTSTSAIHMVHGSIGQRLCYNRKYHGNHNAIREQKVRRSLPSGKGQQVRLCLSGQIPRRQRQQKHDGGAKRHRRNRILESGGILQR